MSDENPDDRTDHALDGDRGIPSVSNEDSGAGFGVAMGIFAVVGVLVLWMFWPESEDTGERGLPAQVDEDFDRERVTRIVIPDLPKDPRPFPEPTRTVAIGEAAAPSAPQLSREELARQQAAADLRERRKRSPLVIYDALQDRPAGAQSGGVSGFQATATGTTSRQQQLINAIAAVNGSGGAGGRPTDLGTVAGRLEESPAPRVTASLLRDREFTIAQGKMIGGVIETAISSDLPGMVRALVSETVYSEDGRNVLVEKGSRIVGEYRAGVVQGQARIFVIWNRIITPFGVDIQITSPGTDPLGRSGLSGWIDSHFMERFGASILLSVVGAAAAQQNDNQFNVELGQGFNESAEIALENSINIRPTLYKNQGDRIRIFVARDLNFKPVMALRNQ